MSRTVLSDLLGFLVLVFCPCKLHAVLRVIISAGQGSCTKKKELPGLSKRFKVDG